MKVSRQTWDHFKKNRTVALLLLAIGYLVLPFFSGLFAWTSDPYGPKIFFDTHHYVLHRAGEFVADRPFSSKPVHLWGKPVPWFYGMGEKVSEEEINRRYKEINEGAEAAMKRFRVRMQSKKKAEEAKQSAQNVGETGMAPNSEHFHEKP